MYFSISDILRTADDYRYRYLRLSIVRSPLRFPSLKKQARLP